MIVPFKLVLRLANPFIMDYQVTLDALVTQAIINASGLSVEEADKYVPLEKVNGVYKASSMFCMANYKIVPLTKIMKLAHNDKQKHKFSPNALRPKGIYGPIITSTGPFMNKVTTYKAKDSAEVYFWGVGDPEKIVSLLKNHIQGIGKRWSNGHGEILDIDYYELEDDFSWVTAKGNPARPLPVDMWDGDSPTMDLATHFPYWESPKTKAVFPLSWVV